MVSKIQTTENLEIWIVIAKQKVIYLRFGAKKVMYFASFIFI